MSNAGTSSLSTQSKTGPRALSKAEIPKPYVTDPMSHMCKTCTQLSQVKGPCWAPCEQSPSGQKGVLAEPVLSAYSASSHTARLVLVFAIN